MIWTYNVLTFISVHSTMHSKFIVHCYSKWLVNVPWKWVRFSTWSIIVCPPACSPYRKGWGNEYSSYSTSCLTCAAIPFVCYGDNNTVASILDRTQHQLQRLQVGHRLYLGSDQCLNWWSVGWSALYAYQALRLVQCIPINYIQCVLTLNRYVHMSLVPGNLNYPVHVWMPLILIIISKSNDFGSILLFI